MKNLILSLLVLLLGFNCSKARPESPIPLSQIQPDTTLHHIQDKIDQAFVETQISRDATSLNQLISSLEKRQQTKPSALLSYWIAYGHYYQTIFYMGLKENDLAEKNVKMGIQVLEEVVEKSTEHYALLAHLQSLSISFGSTFKAIGLSAKVKKNGQKALDIDPNNLRAHLVLGSSDFYTPEKYGGGKKVESYLLKAIELPDQTVENPYLPSWGKNTAYELLIRFYLRKEEKVKAKNLYKKAITAFPNDYMINQLAQKLVE